MGVRWKNLLISATLFITLFSLCHPLHPSQARRLVQLEERDTFTPVHKLKPSNVSGICRKDLHRILEGRGLAEYAALDAFGRMRSGHVTGSNAWLGSYDLCLEHPHVHYFLVLMQVSWAVPHQPHKNNMLDGKELVMWGICVPHNCTGRDAENSILVMANATLPLTKFNITHVRIPKKNEKFNKTDYDPGFVGTVVVFSLFGLIVVIGTIVDGAVNYKKNRAPKLIHKMDSRGSHLVDPQNHLNGSVPRLRVQATSSEGREWENPPTPERIRSLYFKSPGVLTQFLCCFSLLSNTKKFLSTKNGDSGNGDSSSLGYLNGMRVITMFWVILGHCWLLTSFMGLTDNTRVLYQYPSRWTFQPVVNGYFAIDTFFFISGILVCYSTLTYMDKCKGRYPFHKFLFHRYYRLTPLMALVILFYMYIFPYLGDGPLWFIVRKVTQDNCPQYWWTNLLYINNFYPAKAADECLPWVWYLACDIQFFIFSPIILVFLHKESNTMKYVGFSLVALVLLTCFIVRAGIMTLMDDGMGPTPSMGMILPPPRNANGTHNMSNNNYSSDIYVKPYTRVAPYLVGIVIAYFIQRLKGTRKKIPMIAISIGWIMSAALAIVCIYITVVSYNVPDGDYLWNQGGRLIYGTFSKFAWALSLAWVVYACYHGYGGYIEDFLSWRLWIPLGRLTYAVYLLHPLVILWYLFALQEPIHITDNVMSYFYFSVLGCTYIGAVAVLLFIELPLANLEQLLYKLLSCCAGCMQCCAQEERHNYHNMDHQEDRHNYHNMDHQEDRNNYHNLDNVGESHNSVEQPTQSNQV